MLDGAVRFWRETNGYGFIIPEEPREAVFVHRHALQNAQRLEPNDQVQYDLTWNAKKGKYQTAGVVVSNHSQCPAAVEGKPSATTTSSLQVKHAHTQTELPTMAEAKVVVSVNGADKSSVNDLKASPFTAFGASFTQKEPIAEQHDLQKSAKTN